MLCRFPSIPPQALAMAVIRNDANLPKDLSLPAGAENKRRLLLIYIHGFMGSEASFQDLPAHVHELLSGLLGESHVVYTRIYPRYKSHGEIQSAVEQFSAWLKPHEAPDLDIILLGHSLGGIVAADVALLRRHQILGLVNYDVPFLGLHPRVVPTGILSSMPKKDVAPEEKLAGEQESLGMEPAYKVQPEPDPNFDRPWRNDVRLANRGFFKNVMHFVQKNTDNLARSVFDRVVSSAKFAGCVNNYSELRRRYREIMELEKEGKERVRFMNYYTASTGRRKPVKEDEEKKDGKDEEAEKEVKVEESPSQSTTPTPEDSIEKLHISKPSGKDATPQPSPTSQEPSTASATATPSPPELPPKKPTPPPLPERNLPIPDQTTPETSSLHLSESTSESGISLETTESGGEKEQKLRKFILLPKNHWKYHDNAHWTPVLMEDMDEVEAHQSMFIPSGANYDHLVGDTVGLIESWVQADLSARVLQEGLD
ncbi:hypothetical protein N7532_000266 [Penicillium argentinense]|uniref:AB hydrolase-1 domain-containing protein n=1 Tax=Penicillium argentinense TaxID=1131581 RepID=A0A9W9G576_9EURO|nr:uncharacterized protein N7532_000266 [Penicillium argentinense]KAJ5112221.1 hypothetical protein N7532_000266 [Penicillium argentinense]